MDVLLSEYTLLQQVQSPINFLYCELMTCFREKLLRDDKVFQSLLFRVLAHYADYTEHFHKDHWEERTNGLSVSKRLATRKKLNLFLWRINQRLSCMLQRHPPLHDLHIQLLMLSEYMTNCNTRILPLQVVDTCMEVLLQVKVPPPYTPLTPFSKC
jgi:hypothetical protein